jgi:EEF1A N-terminal glycine/lysine methyltransferase
VFGHLWGKKEDELSKKEKFDVIILSDLISNHFAHDDLISSCVSCSHPETLIFVSFSHHRPWFGFLFF